MVERKPNEQKIVAWFMAAKSVIKFANDDATYKLADAVIKASDFTKYPLSKGDRVEVGIKDGVVTYLRKQKSEAKSEPKGSEEAYEPTPEEENKTSAPTTKVEEPKVETPTSDAKVLTVFAVAANKKVVKFLECKDAGWFQINEHIQQQDYKVIGLEARNKANVVINENTVISFVKLASEPVEQPKTTTSSPENAKVVQSGVRPDNDEVYREKSPISAPKKEWKPYSSQDNDGRQKSIEAQAAINSANQVVGRIAANIDPKPTASVLNSMIRAIAENNFALIQELKSK